jgi:hypothetical protein
MAAFRSRRSSSPTDGLACPACGRAYPRDGKHDFCDDCGMPLVVAGVEGESIPAGETRERARKIKPEYARGELVRVAGGRNQAEAELIQNLLLEEGIPSMFKRSVAFDVPDMLAAGERDVLVPESGAQVAREFLIEADLMPSAGVEPMKRPNPVKLLIGFLAGGAITTLIIWVMVELGAG